MTKGTIVRTIMLVLVIINIVLKQTGHDVLNISENEVASFVEAVIEVAVIVVTFWKNNSFTKEAQKADEILKSLKGD